MYTGPKLHTDGLIFAFDPNSGVCNNSLSTGANLATLKCMTNAGPQDLDVLGASGTITTSDTDQGLVMGTATTNQIKYYKSANTFDLSNSDITMTMWAKYTASPGSSAHSGISFHSHGDNDGLALTMRRVDDTNFQVGCSTGTGSTRTYYTYFGTSNIYNTWSHLALTFNNTTDTIKLYVNGVEEKSVSYAQSNPTSRSIYLHVWSTGTLTSSSYRPAYLQGTSTVHKALLTADQLLSNFNATKHRYL